MKHVLIVYWSASGNTETMAKAVAEGASGAGAEVTLKTAGEATIALVRSADALAFGCPAMGAEVLEESEMEPFIASLAAVDVGGKPLGLFGSYDWGDGQWMRDWVERMNGLGARLAGEAVIATLEPDAGALERCRALGAAVAR